MRYKIFEVAENETKNSCPTLTITSLQSSVVLLEYTKKPERSMFNANGLSFPLRFPLLLWRAWEAVDFWVLYLTPLGETETSPGVPHETR